MNLEAPRSLRVRYAAGYAQACKDKRISQQLPDAIAMLHEAGHP